MSPQFDSGLAHNNFLLFNNLTFRKYSNRCIFFKEGSDNCLLSAKKTLVEEYVSTCEFLRLLANSVSQLVFNSYIIK